jgi:hypothetical protein
MNKLYDAARQRMLLGTLDWTALDLVLVALSGTPVFNATDSTVNAVSAHGAVIAGYSASLANKSVTSTGYAKSGPAVVTALAVGPNVTHFVIAERQSPSGNSKPLYYIDDAHSLPYVPNGLDLIVQPDWLSEQGWFRP